MVVWRRGMPWTQEGCTLVRVLLSTACCEEVGAAAFASDASSLRIKWVARERCDAGVELRRCTAPDVPCVRTVRREFPFAAFSTTGFLNLI
jgi:hypothetical protein